MLPSFRKLCAASVVLCLAAPAQAYEFEVGAQTVAQGYQLRARRFDGSAWFLHRRRLSQTLSLDLWDLLTPPGDPDAPRRPAALDVSFSAQLRLDHDFGEWTQGSVQVPIAPDRRDAAPAREAVPELDRGHAALDLIYAHLTVARIAGRVDLRLGRLLDTDSFDWRAYDGASVRARLHRLLVAHASAGLLVRGTTRFVVASFEPDGTSDGQCAAFAEDLGFFTPSEECRSRETLVPTFGLQAEDLPADAPGWGVNEEVVTASVAARLLAGRVVPSAALRWNLLLATVDELRAGVTVRFGDHHVTPEVSRTLPSFDGDSIFNVFVAEPTWDLRVTWELRPQRGSLRFWARGFRRLFIARDDGAVEEIDVGRAAWGGVAGVASRSGRVRWRLDAHGETGYGGLRAGGDASARLTRDLALEARASVVRLDDDDLLAPAETSAGGQLGGLWRLGPGATVHLVVEDNLHEGRNELRIYALVDLAFRPEL